MAQTEQSPKRDFTPVLLGAANLIFSCPEPIIDTTAAVVHGPCAQIPSQQLAFLDPWHTDNTRRGLLTLMLLENQLSIANALSYRMLLK